MAPGERYSAVAPGSGEPMEVPLGKGVPSGAAEASGGQAETWAGGLLPDGDVDDGVATEPGREGQARAAGPGSRLVL